MHDNAITPVLSMLIPIFGIVFGIGIGMFAIWTDYRKRRDLLQAHHAERMAAIEKGIELPPLPPEFFRAMQSKPRSRSDSLRSGLMWLLVGIAITIALWVNERSFAPWGLIPIALGIARLLFYALENRRTSPSGTGASSAHGADD